MKHILSQSMQVSIDMIHISHKMMYLYINPIPTDVFMDHNYRERDGCHPHTYNVGVGVDDLISIL